jgi:peptide deformylase
MEDTIVTPEDLIRRIVSPHKKVSREVTEKDLEKVLSDGQILLDLCYMRAGMYGSAFAMAHSQIEESDPLRFFVMANGLIIINPKIINHTRVPVDSEEGCMSFSEKPQKTVQRYHKIEVKYVTIKEENEKKIFTPVIAASLSGREAKIFQHEIAHMNGKYVYDDNAQPEDALQA